MRDNYRAHHCSQLLREAHQQISRPMPARVVDVVASVAVLDTQLGNNMLRRRAWGPFDGPASYGRALSRGIRTNYSFKPKSLAEEEADRLQYGGRNFRRTLNYLQLICLGVGVIHSGQHLPKCPLLRARIVSSIALVLTWQAPR